MHLVNRAVVRLGKGEDALVVELAIIHGESLPLMLAFANLNSPLKIARHRLQVAKQTLLERSNLVGNAVVAPVAPRPRRDRREELRIRPDAPP